MKTTPVCLIFIAGLLVAPVANGERPDGGGGTRSGSERWQKIDKDGDGAISRPEFADMPRLRQLPDEKRQALFERLDKDGDGRISREEIAHRKPGPNEQRPRMPQLAELDKNSDGMVSFEEFQQARMFQRLNPDRQQRIFKRLDSNGDGNITPEDRPSSPSRPGSEQGEPSDRPRLRGMLERLDTDGDGEISFEEFRTNPRVSRLDEQAARKRYQLLDRNDDGVVDRNDIPRREEARSEGPEGQ